MGYRRLWALGLLCAACGGEATPPPKAPAAPPPSKPAPVVEVPDLSPVAAPPGVFAVGRIRRPTTLADTVAKWAGLPLALRDVLPLAGKDLDAVIAWDAPIELAAAVAPGGRRAPVEAAISLGLTGTEAAIGMARRQGYELKRLAPETYLFAATSHLSCAIAPAIGSASARLVCAHHQAELEDLLPYLTRGLPNAALGEKDFVIDLRLEPIRQRFASEIGSARLFAGFVVRELSIDSHRFDTAVSDAVYAGADELVALVHDLDTVRVEGSLDEPNHTATLETALAFRDHKSWVATAVGDASRRPGPAPDSFFALPADADEGGYSQTRDPHVLDGIRHALLELSDAYLEHEKVGKATRERVARLIQAYSGLDGLSVHAEGSAFIAAGPHDKEPASASSGWMLLRCAAPPAALKGASADLAAVLSDREWRAALARKLKTDEKSLPTGRAVPLTGRGIPPGTRAVVVKVPQGLGQLVAGALHLGSKKLDSDDAFEVAIATVPSGADALVVYAANTKELAARVAQAQNPKEPTLASRKELEPMHRFNATTGGFTSLAHLIGASSFGRRAGGGSLALTSLPHQGQGPIFFEWVSESGAAPKAVLRTTVTAGVFEDLPGLAPMLAGLVIGR